MENEDSAFMGGRISGNLSGRVVSERSTWATRMPGEMVLQLQIEDLVNPFNFFTLLMSPPGNFYQWMADNGLLASKLTCHQCKSECKIYPRPRNCDGFSWRCLANKNHEFSIRKFSFFFRSHLYIQDILMFIYKYSEESSILQCAIATGVGYRRTAVDWASFIRDLFLQWVHDTLPTMMLEGTIEIDESLFGRKVKYHRGDPQPGMDIWVFGLVERGSNRTILLPVDNRKAETLIPLVQRFVKPGSTVYSDGWSAYAGLGAAGYRHFSVVHKHAFRVVYVNEETGAVENVHTNTMEGAWKHAKVC